jgi:hypothetical protein
MTGSTNEETSEILFKHSSVYGKYREHGICFRRWNDSVIPTNRFALSLIISLETFDT